MRTLPALLVFGLIVVWPLPHTAALRNLIEVALLICIWPSWRGVDWQMLKWPILLLAALTFWILMSTVFVAIDPSWSWHEFLGEWPGALLCGFLGVFVATEDASSGSCRMLKAVIGGMSVMLSMLLLKAVWAATHGSIWEDTWLTSNRTSLSYVTNTLFVLLMAEVLGRRRRFPSVLPIGSVGLGLLVLLVLTSTYVLRTRNGTIGLIGVSLLAIFVTARQSRSCRSVWISVTLCLVGLSGFSFLAVRSDTRWQQFQETIPVALDTDSSKAWLGSGVQLPKLPDGRSAEASAYLRIAWIKEGMKTSMRHPLGIGFGRNAFGHALRLEYGDHVTVGHSHSGVLDWLIGIGVPGVLLWFAAMYVTARFGWLAYVDGQHIEGLMLTFVITGFFSRSLVDSTLRDHMLEQFMFLAAFLAARVSLKPSCHVLSPG